MPFALQPCYVIQPAFRIDSIAEDPSNGLWSVTLVNGKVLSIQPDGSDQDRDPGTFGPFERAAGEEVDPVSGIPKFLVYNPEGDKPEGEVFVFRVITVVPNV